MQQLFYFEIIGIISFILLLSFSILLLIVELKQNEVNSLKDSLCLFYFILSIILGMFLIEFEKNICEYGKLSPGNINDSLREIYGTRIAILVMEIIVFLCFSFSKLFSDLKKMKHK